VGQLAPMDPLNGTNGSSNGDEVSGANGGPHRYWRQWMCSIGDNGYRHWRPLDHLL